MSRLETAYFNVNIFNIYNLYLSIYIYIYHICSLSTSVWCSIHWSESLKFLRLHGELQFARFEKELCKLQVGRFAFYGCEIWDRI